MSVDSEREGPATPRPAQSTSKGIDLEVAAGHVARYASLFDFGAVPRSKVSWAVRLFAIAITVALLWKRTVFVTRGLVAAHPVSPIPTQEIEDYRFKLPEHTRRDIFRDLAAVEIAERARAISANTWGGHAWSREDDRGYFERQAARTAAAKYKVSLTQVYLVLDEGIREQWPGPDGKPLPATTPPHSIRTNSW